MRSSSSLCVASSSLLASTTARSSRFLHRSCWKKCWHENHPNNDTGWRMLSSLVGRSNGTNDVVGNGGRIDKNTSRTLNSVCTTNASSSISNSGSSSSSSNGGNNSGRRMNTRSTATTTTIPMMMLSPIQTQQQQTSWTMNFSTHATHNKSNTTTTTKKENIPFYGLPRPKPPPKEESTHYSVGERIMLASKSAATAIMDPTKADAVAALGELTGTRALQQMHHKMRSNHIGHRILQEQPIVSKATLPESMLVQLKLKQQEQQQQQQGEGHNTTTTTGNHNHNNHNDQDITFGAAYVNFLNEHGFDPDDRDKVKYISEEHEHLAYVMLRYRQCHDYFHTLTGLPPTVLGELGIKWLELFHTGLPIAALSSTVGSLALDSFEEQNILWNVYLPWAIDVYQKQQRMEQQQDPQAGNNNHHHSTFLLNVYYEEEFETPLPLLRERLGIVPAPVIKIK